MKKELTFIQQSNCEITGQPSSKRINIRRAMWLVTAIVLTLCLIEIYSVIGKVDIQANALALCFGLIGLIPTFLGFAGWVHYQGTDQSKAAMDAKLVTNLNAVTPDSPSAQPSQPSQAPISTATPIAQP